MDDQLDGKRQNYIFPPLAGGQSRNKT